MQVFVVRMSRRQVLNCQVTITGIRSFISWRRQSWHQTRYIYAHMLPTLTLHRRSTFLNVDLRHYPRSPASDCLDQQSICNCALRHLEVDARAFLPRNAFQHFTSLWKADFKALRIDTGRNTLRPDGDELIFLLPVSFFGRT